MGFAVAVFDVETFGWWEHGVQVSSKVVLVSLGFLMLQSQTPHLGDYFQQVFWPLSLAPHHI
jgi:hypothetical protein